MMKFNKIMRVSICRGRTAVPNSLRPHPRPIHSISGATNARTIFGSFAGAVNPSCTVGLTGAAVSVTSQGLNAQSDCDSFLSQTTNGFLLERDAAALVQAGISRFNVSLDSLQRDRFYALTRRDALDRVLRGLEHLASFPEAHPIKVNAVAIRDKTSGRYPKIGRRAKVGIIAETTPVAGRKMM